jgi:hypothetical protein
MKLEAHIEHDRGNIYETDLPARLDRLPWGRFHTLLVFALGITWLLDGLEVTLAGSISGALKSSPGLHMSNVDIGLAGGVYIAGAVLGALLLAGSLIAWDGASCSSSPFGCTWAPRRRRPFRSIWTCSCCCAS